MVNNVNIFMTPSQLKALRSAIGDSGNVIGEDNGDAYDRARRCWNASVDKRPACVVEVRSDEAVVETLRFCRSEQLRVTVRGGGHSVSGKCLDDGAVCVDLSLRREVTVDRKGQTCVVAGGALWSDVQRTAQDHGFACVAGLVSHTGVAGLTLGGGIGWLSRRFGLACDQLVSVWVALGTSDKIIHLTDDNDTHGILRALRGAGHNLGVVVVRFEIRLLRLSLLPMPPIASTALRRSELFFDIPASDTAGCISLLTMYNRVCASASTSLSIFAFFLHDKVLLVAVQSPPRNTRVDVFDDEAPIVSACAFLESHPSHSFTTRSSITALDLYSAYDSANSPGRHYLWSRSLLLPSLPDSLASLIASHRANHMPENTATLEIMHLGGSIADQSAHFPSSFPARSALYEVHAIASCDSPADPTLLSNAQQWILNWNQSALSLNSTPSQSQSPSEPASSHFPSYVNTDHSENAAEVSLRDKLSLGPHFTRVCELRSKLAKGVISLSPQSHSDSLQKSASQSPSDQPHLGTQV